ncbi:uncharacterized protein G2W53_037155 [Senna tora]|uniref:Uncharacterized protein n=1 Tax=Senna tora TaxID=362788 RepID=A0A834W5T9_9FABA|nr:uncharacterized protein G2W53_037155 [Senna tora]
MGEREKWKSKEEHTLLIQMKRKVVASQLTIWLCSSSHQNEILYLLRSGRRKGEKKRWVLGFWRWELRR